MCPRTTRPDGRTPRRRERASARRATDGRHNQRVRAVASAATAAAVHDGAVPGEGVCLPRAAFVWALVDRPARRRLYQHLRRSPTIWAKSNDDRRSAPDPHRSRRHHVQRQLPVHAAGTTHAAGSEWVCAAADAGWTAYDERRTLTAATAPTAKHAATHSTRPSTLRAAPETRLTRSTCAGPVPAIILRPTISSAGSWTTARERQLPVTVPRIAPTPHVPASTGAVLQPVACVCVPTAALSESLGAYNRTRASGARKNGRRADNVHVFVFTRPRLRPDDEQWQSHSSEKARLR